MKWFLLILEVLLATVANTKVPDPLTILKFQTLSSDSYAVLFTTASVMPNDTSITQYHLHKSVVGGIPKQKDVYTSNRPTLTATENIWKIIFESDPVSYDYLKTKALGIILQGLDDHKNPIISGEAIVENFPVPSQDFEGHYASLALTGAYSNPLTGNILRLTATDFGEMDDINPTPVGDPVENDKTRYYLNAGTETTYSLCKQDSILICETEVPMTLDTIDKESLTITSAKLSYDDTTNSKIVIIAASTATTSTALEVLLDDGGTKSLLVQTAPNLENLEFQLNAHTIGTDITMDIIGLDTNAMNVYVNLQITDYEVYGLPLSTSSLEVRWKYQSSQPNYMIIRDGDSVGRKESTVECNPSMEPDITHCFGYFPLLESGKSYKVTVKLNTSDLSLNDLNMVESMPINTLSLKADLQIEHNIYWNRNGLEGSARVCFHHVESHRIERDFSHYEFVLINNQNGKWIKHKLMTNDTEGELCFSPKTIQKDIFHHTQGATLVLTQRAQDGFTVLASGENQIFLQ